ncbi:MAG: PrsW family glutamic-type intramembrane protease [Candidatus Peregrinibacteria bacterium]|nr:PrsW family glutamic-type intramembrane protease [Candidatus Peregrinibacteria bacterium]
MNLNSLAFDFTLSRGVIALIGVIAVASLDLAGRLKHRNEHYLFACVLGTVLSVGLIRVVDTLLSPGIRENAHSAALGILLIAVSWRMLFGPWEPKTKATVLGTFVFWIALHVLWKESPADRFAHALAIGVALVPAVIWCALFLEYHRERLSAVIMMFFAGMASTVPILFYDTLVRNGIEFQFFLLRIVPESFSATTESFVSGQITGISGVRGTLLSVFLSFVFVGLIEETSKFWVLKRSGQRVFSSIDEVMELAIIVAIGFAFAENIANPGYFLGFVKEYLLIPADKDWMGFFANVLGRSILTSMVHIVATGVFGYFLGVAIFAEPYLEEGKRTGKRHFLAEGIHSLFRVQTKTVFQVEMVILGIVSATLLHTFCNFMVTLPEILPGNPRTLGDLMGSAPDSVLRYVSLLLFPSLLYVVGGFWLLTGLFASRENAKERGRRISTEAFVTVEGVV